MTLPDDRQHRSPERQRPDRQRHDRQTLGLLNAVLDDPVLAKRFAGEPADEKTISIGDTPTALPSPQAGEEPSAALVVGRAQHHEQETLEITPGAASAYGVRTTDQGFVPLRRVATMGGGKRTDADYRLVGKLGSGGTGIVYQAHQRAVDREVAVKWLREELAENQITRDRFLTEARVIGGLDHPNVIALHEVCAEEGGGLFYSMKRIDGASWDQLIEERTVEQNVDTLLRVADAIRYAHSRGLIHRDIKPENVMLGRFGEVLVADWGLAISVNEVGDDNGIHPTIGGTPAYMPPELAVGDLNTISFQTDVYLLGAILYQILSGYPPHHGDSLLACIHAAAHNEIRPTDVEGELMDIALRAMATAPADRYESVEQFVTALSGQRQHEQSARLVRLALERVNEASASNHYEDFRLADAFLMEAIEVWPDNQRAIQARVKLRTEFAKAATRQGDLDLALSLYDAAGLSQSPEAVDARSQRDRRDANQRQASHYSALFTQSPEAGLLIHMSTATVAEANETFGQLFGYDANDVVGTPMKELNLWACTDRRSVLIEQLQQTGKIDNFEAKFLHTDGHPIDVLISGRVVDVHGESMFLSTIRDISIRKQAENDLKRSRQRLRDLQSLAGLATWSFDVISKNVTWSDEAYRLAGRSRDEGAPTPEQYLELIHPENRQNLRNSIDAAIESGTSFAVSVRQMGNRGEYVPIIVRGQPIFDDDGNTVEIYGVLMPDRSAATQ